MITGDLKESQWSSVQVTPVLKVVAQASSLSQVILLGDGVRVRVHVRMHVCLVEMITFGWWWCVCVK